VSQSFGYIPKNGIAGSNGRSMSSFLSNLQIFFQSGCTSLHSHQQCKRVPFPPESLPTPVVRGVANDGYSNRGNLTLLGQMLIDHIYLTQLKPARWCWSNLTYLCFGGEPSRERVHGSENE
jgi:hypothetical protein